MIANLLDLGERREYDALPLDSLGSVQCARGILHDTLVECRWQLKKKGPLWRRGGPSSCSRSTESLSFLLGSVL
jgi:hypothetical protein